MSGQKIATIDVTTMSGVVRGAIRDGVARFLGVPYAEPPIGPLRWRPPAPVAAWDGICDANDFPPDPLQRMRSVTSRGAGTSEDCLTLNIWTPAERSERLPVMVWFYGGSFIGGSASDARSDGAVFARDGVIIVSVTSRVGIFGWLAHSELRAESPHGAAGNYGLMDQIEALRWIRQNIAAFGGDPTRVTLFGVSSGGAAISLLMTSPEAAGLFDQAILQSGGAFRPLADLESAAQAGDALGDVATLRALDAQEVLALEPRLVPAMRGLTTPRILRPIIDGWIIPRDEREAYETGQFAHIPVIAGSNADEGTRLTATWPVHSVADLDATIASNFTSMAEEAKALYPAARDEDVRPALAAMFGDSQFQLGAREIPRNVEKFGGRAYRYVFTRARAGGTDGPHHGGEVGYVFKHLDLPPVVEAGLPCDDRDRALATAFHDSWVQFASTGEPGAFDGVAWPRASEGVLEIGERTCVRTTWRDAQLDLFNRYARQSG